ncbi:hypothetical protein WR25_04649 isoform D [Diploscapter pachys]|uniref:Uncharacterized protein n=1 Tax=Diploscapter pachys TaxID=2018661 RepID=A0A2A2KIP5_9BILA|nr:hypothetical protein WR25_04649 isoform D [Diploscapter pachys]
MSRHMLVADANLDQTNLEETLLMDTSLSGNRSVQEQAEDRDVSALTALSAESIAEEEEEEETFMDATVNGLDETGVSEKFAELEAQLMKQASEKKTVEARAEESDDVLINVDKTEIEDGNTSSLYRTVSEVDTTMDGTLEERIQQLEDELIKEKEQKERAAQMLTEKSAEVAALEEEMVEMNSSLTATQQNSQQVGELEMRLQLLENELGRVTGERERAVALLQEKSAEVTVLEAQINELNTTASTAQDMRRQMHELEVHIQLLDDELARQKGEKESAYALLQQKSEELAALEIRINELSEVAFAAEENNRQIEELKAQVQNLEAEFASQAEEKESAAALLQQKSAEVSTLEARISELTAATSVAQESSQKQVEELETRIQMLESELAMQVEERESAFALLQEKSEEMKALERKISELTAMASTAENSSKQIEEFKAQMQMYEAELARHAEEKESANVVLHQKSEEIAALEARINELTEIASVAEDSNRQIEEFKAQMQLHEAELARHAEEKESTNAVLKEKSDKVTALEIQINDLTVAASVVQETSQKQVEGFETRIQMLESELARHAAEKEGGNTLLQEKAEEIKALEHQISELTAIASAAEDSNRQVEKLKAQMQLYETELTKQAEEKESVAALLKEKSEEATTLQGQMNDLTAAASVSQENSQKQIEGLGTRIQMLESELAMQGEEKESASALLQEKSEEMQALERKISELTVMASTAENSSKQIEEFKAQMQLYEAELTRQAEEKESAAALLQQRSEEVTTLQGQMNDLTASASVTQENSQKQIEGLGTRIQMLESELTRHAEEKEGANALLNERSTRVAALEAEMEKMSSAMAASQQNGLQREALESRIQLLEAELEQEREKSRQSVAKMEETLDEVDEIEERLTSEAVRWKRLYMELKKGVDKENAMMQAAVSGWAHTNIQLEKMSLF